MERLTEKRDGQWVIPLRQDGKREWSLCSAGMGDAPTQFLYGDAADRLAAYEDIGPIDHIRELLQAEQDGRLVVLPCKVGDTIWRIKCFADWPDIGKPYVEADAFLYRDIHYFGKTVFLTREEAEAALKGGDG